MERFSKIFQKAKCNIIGMIHLDALPGTPKYDGSWNAIIEKAKYEANIYKKWKLDALLIENMHDVPYVQSKLMGAETIACMSRIATEVRQLVPAPVPCGIQILAGGNKQALAVAKACNLQFIRAESFVFGHIADEGYMDACAGELLRYRRTINADDVLIFTDLKKKHSSHSITEDVNLLQTAKAAEFFLTDGIVITGNATGQAVSRNDLSQLLAGRIKSPLLIGSGVTNENIMDYFEDVEAAIIGSHFKENGIWSNDLCERSIEAFMQKIEELNKRSKHKAFLI